MISKDEMDSFGSIKEVTDMGQWDIKKRYGWLPKTKYVSTVFAQDGLSIEVCWQKTGFAFDQGAILYFKINLKGKELRKPLSHMLEADEFFHLFFLLDDIQTHGIGTVDIQARKRHYAHYIRKDTNYLLYEAMGSPEKTDKLLKQFKAWSQQEGEFADKCAVVYEAQANPVELYSACGHERKTADAITEYYLTVSHTPMQEPGTPKARPFRIQLKESRGAGNGKMKSVHLDLTTEQFSAFVTAIWEAYKQWWHAK